MSNDTRVAPIKGDLTCRLCDEPMHSSPTSRPQGEAAHRACRTAAKVADCAFCGEVFTTTRRSDGNLTRCCSKSCARRLEIREGRHLLQDGMKIGRDPVVRRASNSRATYKRRALLLGVESDPYSIELIAERDEFTCHLCGGGVDMALFWPEKQSPSADHVVPLSRGGDDTLGNVKLSHLACNMSKGNRA